MTVQSLTTEQRCQLLLLARQAVVHAAEQRDPPRVEEHSVDPPLWADGACFVTLRSRHEGSLRGCTGVLAARKPLALEVVETAARTATSDPRFLPVRPAELADLDIEISVLTPPTLLTVASPEDLPARLCPGIDGVTLTCGQLRATFLPQVWERVPDPVQFLDRLCHKMGLPAGSWQQPGFLIETYQVEAFSEASTAQTAEDM